MSCCDGVQQTDHGAAKSIDWLLWICGSVILAGYLVHVFRGADVWGIHWLHALTHAIYELINTIWWGVVIGVVMLALLTRVPREFVMSALGHKPGFAGLLRATLAGVLLDLCSHGILMVGAKLYERGARVGQVMAFLVASPWNSLSLTFILVALIGLPWTIAFIVFSMIIALVTGWLFEKLVGVGYLPANPHQSDLPAEFDFWAEARRQWREVSLTPAYIATTLLDGVKQSRMVVRWIGFGILLAAAVRTFVSPDQFATYLGPSLLGLLVTLSVATVLEVCSEGSTPVAADILTRAGAPGNSFAFLMGGVATDYTEIMVLRETTASWKVALCLPLVTLPQVIALAWIVNVVAG